MPALRQKSPSALYCLSSCINIISIILFYNIAYAFPIILSEMPPALPNAGPLIMNVLKYFIYISLVLDYTQWRNFIKVIDKAMPAILSYKMVTRAKK